LQIHPEVIVPNLAGVLKGEIRRLARKEVRASVKPLRKLVTALRRRIAEQRRLMAEMERAAKRSIASARKTVAAPSEDPQIRFSPQWVKAHRKKLGVSRRVYAKLVGVSAQSIFGWETGRTRPRRKALESWRRMRTMGKRQLKALPGAAKSGRRGRRAERDRRGRAAAGMGKGRIVAARASRRRRPMAGRRRAAKKK
jgi:DNA-binding transcriptional regulator YiaG